MLNHLFDMVHEGRAAFKTYTTGIGAVWRIPVPKDNYIVLTKIIYHPFIDSNSIYDSPNTLYSLQHHQLRLVTSKKYNVFQFRDEFTRAPGGIYHYFGGGQEEQRATYLVYDETLKINISQSVYNPPSGWTVSNFVPPPAISDEPPAPIGYGGASTLFPFSLDVTQTAVNPFSVNILPSGAAVDSISFDQFQSMPVALIDPTGTAAGEWVGVNFPLVDFEYFQIFEPLPNCMRGK